MVANYLIGLREGLEAALVVAILLAYLVKSDRRHLIAPIWVGVGLAIAASLAFGAVLTFGPRGLSETAEETIGGVLSIVAVALVTWMIFWMARSARSLSGQLRGAVDQAAEAGRASLVGVAVMAVGREGLETALFVWAATGAATRNDGSTAAPLIGALLGLMTAALLGVLFYRGALRINLATFFAWTGGFLVLIAAGVLAYGVHELQEAGLLPGEDAIAFDVSHVIAPDTLVATLLKGTLNFSPRSSVLEVAVWLAYVAIVLTLFIRAIRRPRSPARGQGSPAAAAASEAAGSEVR